MRFNGLYVFRMVIFLCITTLGILSHATHALAVDPVTAGKIVVESPTLICAGFEWPVLGDDNRNASVTVEYRKSGSTTWKTGLPLLRLHNEQVFYPEIDLIYESPNMFAGSIFDLEPATEYECRFTLSDPDGVRGEAVQTVSVVTRKEPEIPTGGRTLHVYPADYKGQKEEPSFEGILNAYYGPGRGLWGSAQVRPGDIILVHGGLYKTERLRYYEPYWMHFHGTYVLTQDGTPDKPIVIKAAGDGEAIFDGDGVYKLFDVMFADYTYIEGLTIKNCDVAVYAGFRYAEGCNGLVVKNCHMEDVGCGVLAQYYKHKNFYIADNVILGRDKRDKLRGWTGMWRDLGELARLDSFIGIDINGQGHAVCHNYIAYFHDAIDITEQGAPEHEDYKCVSIDIYNNDMYHMADDFIEADCSVHNIRVFRNRGFNSAQRGLSAQPIYGGPAYFIRNIIYNVPPGGAFKFNIFPAGVLAYHNTMIAEWSTNPPYSNVHLRNNLFLGIDEPKRVMLSATTYTSYTSFDYDGWRPNRNSEIQFSWKSPGEGKTVDYDLKGGSLEGKFKTLEAFSAATGQEKHGFTVDYDIFRNVTMPDRNEPHRLYKPGDFDFSLKQGSTAVDKGCVLANINDGFTGKAPDPGALEVGDKPVVYGPRK